MNWLYSEWKNKIILLSKCDLTVLIHFSVLRHLVRTWPIYYFLRKYCFDQMKQVYQILVATYTSKHLYILTHIADRWGSHFAVERQANILLVEIILSKKLRVILFNVWSCVSIKTLVYSILRLLCDTRKDITSALNMRFLCEGFMLRTFLVIVDWHAGSIFKFWHDVGFLKLSIRPDIS